MAISIPIVSSFDSRGVKRAESSFRKIGDVAKTAALAVGGLAVAAAAGAWKAIEAASDLGESTSKVGVLFGDAAASVTEFSKTAASELGLSQQAVLDAAGTFGTFGKAAGLGGSDLAKFSNDFTSLSADLASFNNTTPEEAIEAIGSALRGEAEPLRKYGVLLNDATLKQAALELGISDGKAALTSQQKILAAQKVIYEQTTAAQGDFARTSDGLANRQRILKAQLSNVTASIGQKLLPIALKIAQFIGDKLVPVIEHLSGVFSERGFGGVIGEVAGMIRKAIPPALDMLRTLLEKLGAWIVNTGWPWLRKKLGELTAALWEWVKQAVPPALRELGELLKKLGQWVLDTGLPLLVDKLIALGDALVAWIKPRIVPALEALGELLVKIGEWIVTEAVPKIGEQAVKLGVALLGWLADILPDLVTGLGKLLTKVVTWIVTDGVPKLVTEAAKLGLAILDGIVGFIGKLPGALGALLGQLRDFGSSIATAIVNGLIAIWNKLDLEFPRVEVPDWVPGIGGKGFGGFDLFPDLPYLAAGGIVTGPTLAVVGEAGPEAVIPLSRAGQLGNTVNITVNGALDPVATARQIRQILNRDTRLVGFGTLV